MIPFGTAAYYRILSNGECPSVTKRRSEILRHSDTYRPRGVCISTRVHVRVRSRGLLYKCTVLRGQPVYNVPATDLCLKIDPRPLLVHSLTCAARGYYSFDFSYRLITLESVSRTASSHQVYFCLVSEQNLFLQR